jgi:hypothetical protein
MYIGGKIGGMGFRTIDKVGNDDRLVPIPGTVSLIPVEKKRCQIENFKHSISAKNFYTFGVARWFIFKPKIPIWQHFGGP